MLTRSLNQINQVFVNIDIGYKETPISFKLETGAQVNVIPLYMFHQLRCNYLESTSQILLGYGSKPLKVERKCTLACSFKGTQRHHEWRQHRLPQYRDYLHVYH